MSIAFLESIPTSIQILAGFTAISGAGWTWFVRPRIAGMVTEAIGQNREEIAGFHQDLSQKIADTRKDLSREIADTRKDLSDTRRDLSQDLSDTRRDLSQEIAGNRKDLSLAIAGNRDAITATRDLVSAARVETRDLLAEMRDENHRAHEAIGERINGLQVHITQESSALRTEFADLKSDTAKLAGAVEVLTAAMRPSGST